MRMQSSPIYSLVLPAIALLLAGIPAISQNPQTAADPAPGSGPVVPQLMELTGLAPDRARDTVEAVFRIYAGAEGGEALWSETQRVVVGQDGTYAVLLGAATESGLPQSVFAGGQGRWLGVTVERAPEQARVPLASVAYAMKAADAETLGGVPAAEFVTQAQLRTANPPAQTTAAASSGAASGKPLSAPRPNATHPDVSPNTIAMFNGSSTLVSSALAVGSGNDFNVQSGTIGAVTALTTNVNGVSAAVYGYSSAATGPISGVTGTANSTTGAGVTGTERAATGVVSGVAGGANSTTAGAAGVSGLENGPTGAVYGVLGFTGSVGPSAAGVYGFDWSTTGAVYGVEGQAWSITAGATAVAGLENATTGAVHGVSGTAVSTTAGASGVYGTETAATGSTIGVYGQSASTTGIGVKGETTAAGGTAGLFDNAAGSGLVLEGLSKSAKVFSVDSSGNGTFTGNLTVTGKLVKGSGSFKIDDPLDPANKYLSHSFVESPEMMNVYNGNIVTDRHGMATVVLPDYFEALNRDFRYQLTVIGQFAQAIVSAKVQKNRFVIRTSKPGVEVSWQVTGIRQDAYANANRIPVEEDKPEGERGLYLHPEAFGLPASKSVAAAKTPAIAADASQVSSR